MVINHNKSYLKVWMATLHDILKVAATQHVLHIFFKSFTKVMGMWLIIAKSYTKVLRIF